MIIRIREFPSQRRAQQGITYMEVMVATVLIAVMLVPAIQALNDGIGGPVIHRQLAQRHYELAGKLEEVLAQPFGDLDAAASAAGGPQLETSYSDPDTEETPVKVYIWRYDVDNADADNDVFTGGEDDLLWIRVEHADARHALETLLSRY